MTKAGFRISSFRRFSRIFKAPAICIQIGAVMVHIIGGSSYLSKKDQSN